MKSLKKGVVLTIINTLCTLLFPLVTYSYVARILKPEGIGLYNIAYQIMTYFLIFATLGIPLLATREIGAANTDKELLRKKASNIFFLNLTTSIITFSFYFLFLFLDNKAFNNFWLFFIVGLEIFSICLNVEWYYRGTEQYFFITLRNIIVKIICLILIFIFIKTKDDLILYAIIMILSTLFYSFFNFFKFLSQVKPSIKYFNIKIIIRPVLFAFFIQATSKLASSLDIVMMNYMLGETANYIVGQYVAATKVINMLIDISLIINTVLLPRISFYLAKNDFIETNKLIKLSSYLTLLFCLPLSFGLFFTAKEITLILSGIDYTDSIMTMMIASINIFLCTFTNFFGVQILYAYKKDKLTTLAISIGFIINFTLNLFLIPQLKHNGAAISTVISNFTTLLLEYIFVIKYCKVKIFDKNIIKIFASVTIMTCALFIIFISLEVNYIISFIIKVLSGIMIYSLILLILKEKGFKYILINIKQLLTKIFNKKNLNKKTNDFKFKLSTSKFIYLNKKNNFK